MTDDTHQKQLSQLEERINRAKASQAPRPHIEEHYSQAHMAWRMVIELVTGLGVGFGIGYGLDAAFGTLPVFLVVFVLLGFAAGVRVMMRTAQEIGSKAMTKAEKATTPGTPASDD